MNWNLNMLTRTWCTWMVNVLRDHGMSLVLSSMDIFMNAKARIKLYQVNSGGRSIARNPMVRRETLEEVLNLYKQM